MEIPILLQNTFFSLLFGKYIRKHPSAVQNMNVNKIF